MKKNKKSNRVFGEKTKLVGAIIAILGLGISMDATVSMNNIMNTEIHIRSKLFKEDNVKDIISDDIVLEDLEEFCKMEIYYARNA